MVWSLVGILLFLGLIVGVYFDLFGKKSKTTLSIRQILAFEESAKDFLILCNGILIYN